VFAGAVAEAESGAGTQSAKDVRPSAGPQLPAQGGAGSSAASDEDDDDTGGPSPPAEVQPGPSDALTRLSIQMLADG